MFKIRRHFRFNAKVFFSVRLKIFLRSLSLSLHELK